jgi:hypothetical protein
MERVRETYDTELDARYAAARGFVDAIITPESTRDAIYLSLRTSLNHNGPHLGPVRFASEPDLNRSQQHPTCRDFFTSFFETAVTVSRRPASVTRLKSSLRLTPTPLIIRLVNDTLAEMRDNYKEGCI